MPSRNIHHSPQVSPRTMYVSDMGYFTYNVEKDEFGTNRRHAASCHILAQAIIEGIQEHDRLRECDDEELLPGRVDVKVKRDTDEAQGIRIDNPRLLYEGLQAYMHLSTPKGAISHAPLVQIASVELIDFIHDLARKGVLQNTPLASTE